MKFKTTLAAAILALAPTFAMASPMGCSSEHVTEQAGSCIQGYAWDAKSSSCVEQVTG